MLYMISAQIELLLRHNGIAPSTAPNGEGHDDSQGRRTADIPKMSEH